jgi:hypothetical protein
LLLANKLERMAWAVQIRSLLVSRWHNHVIARPVFAEGSDSLSCFAYVLKGADQHSLAIWQRAYDFIGSFQCAFHSPIVPVSRGPSGDGKHQDR